MNKNHRILASTILLVSGALFIGYGFTAVDFAFSADRWSENNDRSSEFPILGKVTTPDAFNAGLTAAFAGFIMIIVGSMITVANYSTARHAWKLVTGAMLIGWGIWGIAFSFNTADWRVQHGIDRVEIPCLNFCWFTSEDWLLINIGMMGFGLLILATGIMQARYVTKHNFSVT